MFRSIQWRIAIPYVLLILISMCVLGFYLIGFVKDVRIDDLRSQLEGEARLVGRASIPLFDDSEQFDDLTKTLSRQIDARVTIIAHDGTVKGDSEEDPAAMENHAARPEVRDAMSFGFGESTRYSTTLEQKMMYVAVPIESVGTVVGVARVALPMTEIDRSINRLMATVALVMVITTLFAVVVALFIARATTGPIKTVTVAAKRIASGELNQKIYVKTQDESAELASAFNEMAQSLRQMIDALSAERNKLAAVLSSMADGVMMTDAEGNILMTNSAVSKLFGVEEKSAIGHPLIEVIPNHEINDVLKSCLKGGEQQAAQIEQSSGRLFLRVVATPVPGDSMNGALLLFQDLTEVRRLQTVRQKFVGDISHELRTPLASIKAIVETLSEGAIDDRNVAGDFLSRIDGEIDRMTQMVRELAELSRIETGQIKLKIAPVDLTLLIDEAITNLKPQAERKRIEISKQIGPSLPMVSVEGERIHQVLTNLLHNAIKFTHSGGKITLSAKSEGDGIVVSVADIGVGIPDDDLPHIFERFYKADKARSGEGTGLGLAIAKHIIQAHGGDIWAESEEGRGSVFSFRLPTIP